MTEDEQWMLVRSLHNCLQIRKKEDLLYLCDNRVWLGGLRAGHAIVEDIDDSLQGEQIVVGQRLFDALVKGRKGKTSSKVN